MESVFVELRAVITDFQEKMAVARGEMADTEKAGGSHFSSLSTFGKGALLGVAGAAAVVGVASVKMAADFQQNMSKLVTSGGESAANLKSDMSGVEKLMGQTGTSATQLAAGLYTINSAGFHGADGLTVLKAAAQGAKTENADLTTVTDGLTTLLNDYHLKASDAALVTSKMVEATSLGKTTFQDLAGSLHTVSPAADAAGISMNEVLGAMATMTAKGTPAADAATYLRQTILQLENPSKKASDEMSALGLSSIDVSKNLGQRGLTGTLQLLTDAIQSKMGPAGTVLIDNLKQAAAAGSGWAQNLQQMTPAQQTQIKSLADMGVQVDQLKTKLAGGAKETDADRQFIAKYTASLNGMPSSFRSVLDGLIANKLGYQDLNSTIAKLPPAQQTAVGALADMVGGTKSMQAALELTGESAATFQDNVKKAAGAATEAGGNVAGWATVQKNFNQKLAEAEQTVAALGIRLGIVLIPILEQVASTVASVAIWFEKHRAVAEALAIVVGTVLVAAIAVYIAGMIAAAAATIAATWPILAVMAAVTLLVTGIILLATHWNQVWSNIKQWTGDAYQFIQQHWYLLMGIPLIGWLLAIAVNWNNIHKGFMDAVGWTVATIVNYWNGFLGFFEGIPGFIENVGASMWGGIVDGFKAAIDWVIGLWNDFANSTQFTLPKIDLGPVHLGGESIGPVVPTIPLLATGGTVTTEGLAYIHTGEQVVPAAKVSRGTGGAGSGPSGDLVIQLSGQEFMRVAGPVLRKWFEQGPARNAVRGRLTG